MPNIYVIAGPNGAGKSTTARMLLNRFLNCTEFVNADDIAKGLSAFRPESVAVKAGRFMLTRMDELARQRVDFAFETTLSSRSLARWLSVKKDEGFGVHLFYLWVPHPDIAVARVASRVAAGGHHIPEKDIRRRYDRSIANFLEIYMSLVTAWEVYDTSVNEFHSLASGGRGDLTVIDASRWQQFAERKYDSES